MKKSVIITLLGLMAMASCVREPGPGSNVAPAVPTTRLTINSADPGTKTYMEYDSDNDYYIPKWHNGDVVGAFVDNFNADATAAHGSLTNGNADGASASFSGDVSALSEGDHTAYAFYPARAFYGTESGKVVNLEIPEIQFPSATSFDRKADILVGVPKVFTVTSGTADPIEDAQFRRVCAILKVTLVDQTGQNLSAENVKSVRLDFASGQNVTGAFRYDFTNEEACDNHLVAASAKPNVTADYSGSPVAFDSPFFLLVNPGTYTGALTITVLTDKHEIVKTVANIGTWELFSGKVRPIPVKLGNNTTVERVYFQDNFDWLFKWWDTSYYNAYTRNTKNLDPVMTKSTDDKADPPYGMPNLYTIAASSDFEGHGYTDLNSPNTTLYMQWHYLKFGRTNVHSGLTMPEIPFGDSPVDVELSFKWTGQDNVPLSIDVRNGGSASTVSIPQSSLLAWTKESISLNGVTTDTRIDIHPTVETYTTTGKNRWFIDDIKVIPLSTPVSFPVTWSFPAVSSSWVEGEDYHIQDNARTGTYIYSDSHKGRLSVFRAGSTDMNVPTYSVRNYTDTDGSTKKGDMQLSHIGIGKGSFYQFEVYNVKNQAGNYTISFKMYSSAGGAKYFRLEYSLDGSWDNPVPIGANQSAPESYGSSTNVDYTFAIPYVSSATRAIQVNQSFHLDAMDSFKTLKIRVIAVSSVNCSESSDASVNTTAVNRIICGPTIKFTPD